MSKKSETAKTLDNTNVNEVKENVSDVKIFGNGDLFTLIAKASSEKEDWMKSTKAMTVGNGVLVQVSTQQGDNVAEALTFIPNARIKEDKKGNKFIE